MNEIKIPENIFPFECSNPDCNSVYDIKGFSDVYILWGYIFLISGDKCLLGLTCPKCKHTTVKQFSAIPLDFSITTVDNLSKEGTNTHYAHESPIYFIKFSPALIPDCKIMTPNDDTPQNEVYGLPSEFMPIRFNQELNQIPSNIDSKDIDKLLKLENEQNLKVFSRIVPFNSVYYLSDVWMKNVEIETALSPDVLEECHNSLEILYSNGYRQQNDNNYLKKRMPYDSKVLNDLTEVEFQNMDRDLYAWNTKNFKNNIIEFLKTYRLMRNRKDFELICYNELINKYARKFYHNPQLVAEKKFEEEQYSIATQHIEEPEQEEEFVFNEDGNAFLPDSQKIVQGPILAPKTPNFQNPQPKIETLGTKTINGLNADIIEKFNKIHAIVDYGGQILIMNEKFDPTLERQYQTFSKKTDFFDKYANKRMQDPDNSKKIITKAQYWWKHEARKSYEGIVFSPGKDVPGFYNLWKGFPINPVNRSWSLFRDHILRIISNNDNEIFKWIMGWMARIVQDPGGDRPGTAIVLRGGQGTGKTFFAKTFGSLFGRHYLSLSHSSHLIGQFNHHLKDALVVFVDEGFLVGDKKSEGLLKSMVTEPVLNIEQKFKDLITVKNHINLIVASNNENIVPAGIDERRFFVNDISEDQKQNEAYFSAIAQQMNNGGREAMLYELKYWDYSGTPLRKIPKTKALFDQKYNSMNTVQKFWYEKLQDGRLSKTHQKWEGRVFFQDLYREYHIFAKTINDKHTLAETTFGKELRKVSKSMGKEKPNDGGVRDHIKKFPILNICRNEFEALIGMTGIIEWDDTADFSPPSTNGIVM